ncbi:MAG: sialate O-acetylesterase, partial [Melioribacteraceae bacterium]|nr:sialate O-acetylesterase [Melioribacteraceae bacterium]
MIIKLQFKRVMLFFFLSVISFAQVKLPMLISDGMVLQRGIELNIWGWATEGEEIEVKFIDSIYNAIADSLGNWNVLIPKQAAGGPYDMTIKGSNEIKIKDILIGDVWVCSGQSNMELPMKRVSWNYTGEIKNSENKYLRQFYVPRKYNFNESQIDVDEGMWKSASSENTPEFSATAYFFGKELYQKYKVPVGLINTSLGGSPVESWISADSLKRFPKYFNETEMFKDSALIDIVENNDNYRRDAWYNLLRKIDIGYKDPKQTWINPNLDDSFWPTMQVPGYWADTDLGFVNGVVWFRKKVNIPSNMIGKPAKLILGTIVDADSAFINGEFVGTISY